MDLRDVLRGLRQGQAPAGQKQFGDRVSWMKKTPGSHMLRIYRFQHEGKPQFVGVRAVHRVEGGSPPFVPCTAKDPNDPGATCSLCKSWAELIKMAKLATDINREAAWIRAREIRAQTKYEFIVVNSNEPTGFMILELPEGAGRKLFLAAAKEAGYTGTYPASPGRDATDEEKQKAEAFLAEFNVLAEQGLGVLCGPSGRDVVLTYNPKAANKSDFYTVDIVRGVPRTIPLPEDASVPDPIEVRNRIEASRSRKA